MIFCKMRYDHDENGKEILLKEDTFQVMMEWEKPYMQACIDELQPFGDVLEIGFGLGYSASHIQSHKPKSHTIIEYHPLIAQKARDFAKKYSHVTIIEDTWQNALKSLGVFDCIFFDDYPLESQQYLEKIEKESQESSLIVKQAELLIKEINQQFPNLSTQKYSDQDLDDFVKTIASEPKEQLVTFLQQLYNNKQITKKQFERLAKKHNMHLKEPSKRQPFNFQGPSDRLFAFLQPCLASHMRNGSRFSCFLSDPNSKLIDLRFSEIIANPYLDYQEKQISIKVPDNCKYYKGDKALVIVITKRL
jgi:predicted O-methyltransferase YrrM